MRYNPIPKKGDRGINFDSWSNVNRQALKLNNIQFDATVFTVQDDASGMYVSISPQTAANTVSSEFHFEVVANTASVDVHGGVWYRHVADLSYPIPASWGEHYDDVYTLATPTSGYVYLKLNDPLKPTSVTVDIVTGAYPITDTVYKNTVLAYANVSGTTVTVEPYYVGDITEAYSRPDAMSLSYNTDNKQEILGWKAQEEETPFLDDDEFVIRPFVWPDSYGAVKYKRMDALMDYIEDWFAYYAWTFFPLDQKSLDWNVIAQDDAAAEIKGYLSGTNNVLPYSSGDRLIVRPADVGGVSQDVAFRSYSNVASQIPHADLMNFDDDSHNINDTQAGKGGYLRTDGNAARNLMTGVISDHDEVISIEPDSRIFKDSAGNEVLNYDEAGVVKVKSLQLLDNDQNYWNTNSFSVINDGGATLTTDNDIDLNAGAVLRINTAYTVLQSENELNITTPLITVNSHNGLESTAGTLYLCNSTGYAIQQVFVRNGILCVD